MLRKKCTQGPQCFGFPSGLFSFLCTHLFCSHPSLPASVCDTRTQNQTSNPKPHFLKYAHFTPCEIPPWFLFPIPLP